MYLITDSNASGINFIFSVKKTKSLIFQEYNEMMYFFVFSNDPENSVRSVLQVSLSDIAHDGVLIEVEWSSVNFKDGLASTTSGKISRLKPMIPGIDIAGIVVDAAAIRPVHADGGDVEYRRVNDERFVDRYLVSAHAERGLLSASFHDAIALRR